MRGQPTKTTQTRIDSGRGEDKKVIFGRLYKNTMQCDDGKLMHGCIDGSLSLAFSLPNEKVLVDVGDDTSASDSCLDE